MSTAQAPLLPNHSLTRAFRYVVDGRECNESSLPHTGKRLVSSNVRPLPVTLIHSEVTSDWALQVSDRLLTVSGGGQVRDFDARANKTIVFHAADGIATLSYTGLGFLERAPTDAWIAHKLNGEEHPFDPGRVDFTVRFGIRRSNWPLLGFALRQLATRLSNAAKTDRKLRSLPISIAVAGWQWYRRKPPKPFLALIGQAEPGKYVAKWAPRQHRRYFLHLTAPKGYIPSHEAEAIDQRLSQTDLTEATSVLVSSIRRVAARTKTEVAPEIRTWR